MSDPTRDTPTLGVTAGMIDIDRRDELARLSLAMARQCRRRLDIVSRHLDPAIYDNEAFSETVKDLVLNNRQARVRLLIIDAGPLVTHGHRVVDLANRLPSYIEIRAPALQHKSFNESFLLADGEGFIHRQFSDRFEAQANFADRGLTAGFADQFGNMWERSVPETRFRRLHI